MVYATYIALLSIAAPVMLFMISAAEKNRGVPKPMFILGWTVLIGFTLKGVYLSMTLGQDYVHRLQHLGDANIGIGVSAIFFALILMVVGYVMTPNKKLRRLVGRLKVSRSSSTVIYFGLFMLSVALMLMFFTQMGFWSQLASMRFTSQKYFVLNDGQATALGFLTIGGDFLLVYGLYYFVFKQDMKQLNIYVAVVAFLFLTYFISSRRNAALIMIIAFLMVMGIKEFKFNLGRKGKVLGIVAVLLISLSFASSIRDTGRKGTKLDNITVSDAIGATIRHSMYGGYFMGPAKVGGIITETRERHLYQNGISFYGVVFAPIPRVLWAGKPPIRRNHYVSQVVLKVPTEKTGMPPSAVGELYLNFGWLGVILGSLLLGSLMKVTYFKYLTAEDKRFARIPYAMTMLCIVLFLLADFAMAAIFAVKYAMAIFVCSNFWRWKEAGNAKVSRV